MKKNLKNIDVLRHFFNQKAAMSWTSNFSTCGKRLYSYDLEIARFDDEGDIVVFDYTAPAGCFESMTTSSHVGMVKREAPRRTTTIMRPATAMVAGLIKTWGN